MKFVLLSSLSLLFIACDGHHGKGQRVDWMVEVTPGEEKPSITLPVHGDEYEAAVPYSRVVVTAELPRQAKGGIRRVFNLSSVGEQKVRQEVACSTAGEKGARFYCQL